MKTIEEIENFLSHIDYAELLEEFVHENPYGDSMDLTKYMFRKGVFSSQIF